MDGIKKKVTDMKKTGRTPVPVFSANSDMEPVLVIKKPILRTVKKPPAEHINHPREPLSERIYQDARNRMYRTYTLRLFIIVCIVVGIFTCITLLLDQTHITIEPVTYEYQGTTDVMATVYPTVRSINYAVITEQFTESLDTSVLYAKLEKQIPVGSFTNPELLLTSTPITDTPTDTTIITSYKASLIFFKKSDIEKYIREYIFQTKFPIIFSGLDTVHITLKNPAFINAKNPESTIAVTFSGTIKGVSYINPDTVRDLIVGIDRSVCRKTLENNDTIGINRALCHVFPVWRMKTSDADFKIKVQLYQSK